MKKLFAVVVLFLVVVSNVSAGSSEFKVGIGPEINWTNVPITSDPTIGNVVLGNPAIGENIFLQYRPKYLFGTIAVKAEASMFGKQDFASENLSVSGSETTSSCGFILKVYPPVKGHIEPYGGIGADYVSVIGGYSRPTTQTINIYGQSVDIPTMTTTAVCLGSWIPKAEVGADISIIDDHFSIYIEGFDMFLNEMKGGEADNLAKKASSIGLSVGGAISF